MIYIIRFIPFSTSQADQEQVAFLKSIVDLQDQFRTTILFVPIPRNGNSEYDSLLPVLFRIITKSKLNYGNRQYFDNYC